MKISYLALIIIALCTSLNAQTIEKPNFSTATHPMDVEKIEIGDNQTIFYLSIANQSETGYFCADKNIYLVDAISNKKYKLIKSANIPVCPDNHYFKSIGEVLEFQLYFPKINPETKYLNLIEDCNQNCFKIIGIVINKDLNKEIDLGYNSYSSGNTELALSIFQNTLKNHVDYQFGNLYVNIIQILAEKKDFAGAKSWYKKLSSSKFADKTEAINRLKQEYYYTKLIF